MSKLKALLDRESTAGAVDFSFILFAPEIGETPITGKVFKADSKEWQKASVDCKRLWAEGKITADSFSAELVTAIVTECYVDGEQVDKEQLKELMIKYPSLLDQIDRESTAGSVFTLKPQSNSLSTQSGKSGSTSQPQKTAKSQEKTITRS